MPDQLFFDIVKMVVALACIVGLIFGVVFILKRLLPGAVRGSGERITLQVLAQLSLGARQRLCVVRVHDRTLVLGVTEGSINTLAELPPQRSEALKEADDPKIFADLLSWRKDGASPDAKVVEPVHAQAQPGAPVRPAPRDRDEGPKLFAPGQGPAR